MAYQSLANKLQQFGVDLSPQNRQIVQVPDFYDEVPPGSHVAVPSYRTLLGPWHHGLYIGDKKIIHMTGEGKEDAHVQQTSVNEFTIGTNVVALVLYADDGAASRAASVEAAQYLMNILPTANLYDIEHFNCEHFAVLCRTGLQRYAAAISTLLMLMYMLAPPIKKAGKPGVMQMLF